MLTPKPSSCPSPSLLRQRLPLLDMGLPLRACMARQREGAFHQCCCFLLALSQGFVLPERAVPHAKTQLAGCGATVQLMSLALSLPSLSRKRHESAMNSAIGRGCSSCCSSGEGISERKGPSPGFRTTSSLAGVETGSFMGSFHANRP